MIEAWGALSGMAQFFYVIALVSSFILALQFILNLLGVIGPDLDFDGVPDTDLDFDVDGPDFDFDDAGLDLFSVRTVLAFLIGFGWAGVIMTRSEAGLLPVALVALAVGVAFMLVIFWLMRFIYSLSESGNIDIANAVGQTGTVYVTVPPSGQGHGQVQVVVQGRLRELSAVTDAPTALSPGVSVRVAKVLADRTVLVQPVDIS